MAEPITDSYLTIDAPAEAEIKIKGSRFIGLGFPAESVDEAQALLESVRKKEFSATHHCSAWTVGLVDESFKYSDDGEPTGTAGLPIYRVITGRNLKNIIAIVVRYFGGTKLGTGGLTRAYSDATMAMLENAKIVERLICDRVSFTLPFTYYDRLMRIIDADKFAIVKQDFAEDVSMSLEIRKSKTDGFVSRMIELTGGKFAFEKNG
ncbi:MAG: YigZ family protein [Candidatus Zixiibacteriota bacterium]